MTWLFYAKESNKQNDVDKEQYSQIKENQKKITLVDM